MQFVDLKKFTTATFLFLLSQFLYHTHASVFFTFFKSSIIKSPPKTVKYNVSSLKIKLTAPPSFILISASFVFKSTFLITPCKLGFDSFSTPPSGAGNIHRLRTLAFAHPITQIRMHTPMLIALTCLKTFISNSLSRMRIHPTCHFLTQLIYIFILCTGTSHSWFPALSRSIRIAQR